MNIELDEQQLIYILNSINITLKFMTYHYQITDIKREIKEYFNYNNYDFDYNNLISLHRILSLSGNRNFYNVKNDIFFIGQKDYLCKSDKTFEFLKDFKRYKRCKNINEKIVNQNRKVNFFKFKNKFNYFRNH